MKLKLLFDQATILAGVKQLANRLNRVYQTPREPIILIGILKGCLPFMMELIKHLKFEIVMDFMIISSYFGKTAAIKTPKLTLDTEINLAGRNVLIIEDVIESGKTIDFAIKHLNQKKPQTIKVASLLYKQTTETIMTPDYYVLSVANQHFLVGFGLDYQEQKRNLNYIGALLDES